MDIQLVVVGAWIGTGDLHVEAARRSKSHIAAGEDAGAVAWRDDAVGRNSADRAGSAERSAQIHDDGDLRLGTVDHEFASRPVHVSNTRSEERRVGKEC